MGINARMYGYGLSKMFFGYANWGESDTCKVALLKNTYTPNTPTLGISQDSDAYWSDVSAHEITGTGYVAGGKALTFVNGYLDVEALPSPGGVMSFKADDITWSNLTTDDDAYYGIVYYDSGDPNSSPILGYITFASPLQAVDEDLPIEWAGGFVGSISLDISNPVNPPWSRLWMSALTSAFEQKYVWGDGNWRMALMKTTWSPDQDTQFTWSDISAGELAASGGYGQETLAFTGGSITYEAAPNYGGTINLKADATVTFTGVTSSHPFQWAVIYYNVSPYPLLGYMKLDQSYATTGRNVTFTILGGGIVFSVALDTAADT